MDAVSRFLTVSSDASDPLLLVASAVSLVVILAFLCAGGWKLVTNLVIKAFYLAFSVFMCAWMYMAAVFWFAVFSVEPHERAATLLKAITLNGMLILALCFIGGDSGVMRFLRKCYRFLTFPET